MGIMCVPQFFEPVYKTEITTETEIDSSKTSLKLLMSCFVVPKSRTLSHSMHRI